MIEYMPVDTFKAILKAILNATKDETNVVALIKNTIEGSNKKWWQHLQDNKDFLNKHCENVRSFICAARGY